MVTCMHPRKPVQEITEIKTKTKDNYIDKVTFIHMRVYTHKDFQ